MSKFGKLRIGLLLLVVSLSGCTIPQPITSNPPLNPQFKVENAEAIAGPESIMVKWKNPAEAVDRIDLFYGIEGTALNRFDGKLNNNGTLISKLENNKIYVIKIVIYISKTNSSYITELRATPVAG